MKASLKNEEKKIDLKMSRYKDIELDNSINLLAEPQYELFFNNGENERKEEGTLRVLSLFSGCGGMDIAFCL